MGEKMKKILDKNAAGFCSSYMLCCGYIDTFENSQGRITMWHENGSAPYHVQVSALSQKMQELFPVIDGDRSNQWKSFETVKEARKTFREFRRIMKRKLKN